MGREMGGSFKREGIYVYLWLIQRSLSGYTLGGCKESDMTERLTHTHKYYCLTDVMDMNLGKLWGMVRDREASYAAVHGLTKSWT